MKPSKYTSAQTLFDDVLSSRSFIDIVLNQSTNCFLLLNQEMKLQAFNSSLRTLFYNKHGDDYLLKRCGEVIGCAFSIDEDSDCGSTDYCNSCTLRATAVLSYANGQSVVNQCLSREFYVSEDKKELKYLNFSTHPFTHNGDYYTMMVIEDNTEAANLRKQLEGLKQVRH